MNLYCTEILLDSEEETKIAIDFSISDKTFPQRPIFGIFNHPESLFPIYGNIYCEKEFSICYRKQRIIRKEVLSLFDLSSIVLLKNLSNRSRPNSKAICARYGLEAVDLSAYDLKSNPLSFFLYAYLSKIHLSHINPCNIYIVEGK